MISYSRKSLTMVGILENALWDSYIQKSWDVPWRARSLLDQLIFTLLSHFLLKTSQRPARDLCEILHHLRWNQPRIFLDAVTLLICGVMYCKSGCMKVCSSMSWKVRGLQLLLLDSYFQIEGSALTLFIVCTPKWCWKRLNTTWLLVITAFANAFVILLPPCWFSNITFSSRSAMSQLIHVYS